MAKYCIKIPNGKSYHPDSSLLQFNISKALVSQADKLAFACVLALTRPLWVEAAMKIPAQRPSNLCPEIMFLFFFLFR